MYYTCCNLFCSSCVATILKSLCKRLRAAATAKGASIRSILYKKVADTVTGKGQVHQMILKHTKY